MEIQTKEGIHSLKRPPVNSLWLLWLLLDFFGLYLSGTLKFLFLDIIILFLVRPWQGGGLEKPNIS